MAAGEGYCTQQGCSSSADCDGEFACVTGESSYCERPPTGQGMQCGGPADCADYEANICVVPLANMCVTGGCKIDANDCFEGWVCCDPAGDGAVTFCVLPSNAEFLTSFVPEALCSQ